MNVCSKCGRLLNDGEVCNCAPNPQQFAGPPVYNNVNYAQPPKKKSSVWLIILAIALPILLLAVIVLGILAAILIPTMNGYTAKARVSASNASASTFYKAGNSALTELDEQGYTVFTGTYIIGSDKSKTYSVPCNDNFDIDVFCSTMNDYFGDMNDVEWFLVIDRGLVVYAASAKSWKSTPVGTAPTPASKPDGPALSDGTYTHDPKDTLNDVFEKTYSRYFG